MYPKTSSASLVLMTIVGLATAGDLLIKFPGMLRARAPVFSTIPTPAAAVPEAAIPIAAIPAATIPTSASVPVAPVSAASAGIGAVSNDVAAPATVAGTNMQTFTQALGGAQADAITETGDPSKPFSVNGTSFNDFKTAAIRSCNNQHNACAAIANGPTGNSGSGGKIADGLTVAQCDTQQTACIAQQDNVVVATSSAVTVQATQPTSAPSVQAEGTTATTSANQTLKSADAEFFYICDL